MDVVVDGVQQKCFEREAATLLETVVAVSSRLQQENRALVAIRVDGNNVTPDDLRTGTGDKTVDTIQIIEITSEPVAHLVEQSLRELDEYLPMLPQVCHSLASIFQSDAPEEGFAPFHQLADIWHAVKVREMQLANALGVQLDSVEIEGRTVHQMTGELNEFLREAEEAIRAGDSVALGDLLAYELAPRAEVEAKIVANLRGHVPKSTV